MERWFGVRRQLRQTQTKMRNQRGRRLLVEIASCLGARLAAQRYE